MGERECYIECFNQEGNCGYDELCKYQKVEGRKLPRTPPPPPLYFFTNRK